jgi:hypothetical protein
VALAKIVCNISGAICSCEAPFICVSSDCVYAGLRITTLGVDQQRKTRFRLI